MKKVILIALITGLVVYCILTIRSCNEDGYVVAHPSTFDTSLMQSVEAVNINHAEIK